MQAPICQSPGGGHEGCLGRSWVHEVKPVTLGDCACAVWLGKLQAGARQPLRPSTALPGRPRWLRDRPVLLSEQQTRLLAEDGGGAEAGEVTPGWKQGQVLLLLLQQEAAGVSAGPGSRGDHPVSHASHMHGPTACSTHTHHIPTPCRAHLPHSTPRMLHIAHTAPTLWAAYGMHRSHRAGLVHHMGVFPTHHTPASCSSRVRA